VAGKTRKCPHCGTEVGDDAQIVSVVDTASELQKEVSIANMPEEIRDTIIKKTSKTETTADKPSAKNLLECIRIAAIDDVVNLNRLAGALRGKQIVIDAEDVAEEAVSQGLLLRQSNGTYILLG
tara:strand:- start:80 stop:451 length:372 start_codon:yes stop_codon:yes gene_type:complete